MGFFLQEIVTFTRGNYFSVYLYIYLFIYLSIEKNILANGNFFLSKANHIFIK